MPGWCWRMQEGASSVSPVEEMLPESWQKKAFAPLSVDSSALPPKEELIPLLAWVFKPCLLFSLWANCLCRTTVFLSSVFVTEEICEKKIMRTWVKKKRNCWRLEDIRTKISHGVLNKHVQWTIFNVRTTFFNPCLNVHIFPCIMVVLLDLVMLCLLYK